MKNTRTKNVFTLLSQNSPVPKEEIMQIFLTRIWNSVKYISWFRARGRVSKHSLRGNMHRFPRTSRRLLPPRCALQSFFFRKRASRGRRKNTVFLPQYLPDFCFAKLRKHAGAGCVFFAQIATEGHELDKVLCCFCWQIAQKPPLLLQCLPDFCEFHFRFQK